MNLEESGVSSQINLRNKGLRTAGGRVHKGCVKDAFTKLSIGSIPSNYESIIYHHEEKRGFGTSQKRFFEDCLSEAKQQTEVLPGEAHSPVQVSHSSKGYGPLIAREKREWMAMPHSPGPGKYFSMEQLIEREKMKRKCYTRERENFKRSEILVSKENRPTPGPGDYEVEQSAGVPGCKSSFATREKREAYIPRSATPGPGCYTADAGTRQEKQRVREPLDEEIFAKMSQQEKRVKNKLFLARKKHEGAPGPGHYDYDVPNFKPLYERIKISSNFMQTGKDRFDCSVQVKEHPAGPTPCSYQLPSAFDHAEKKFIDMSCFMSESKREPFAGVQSRLGPNLQSKGEEQKRNYHFNIRGQWL